MGKTENVKPAGDCHTHTNFSDGSWSPAELVRRAKERGLKGIAVTDHDCVKAVFPSLDAGHRLDIVVVPGTEISSHWNGYDVHILGYAPKLNKLDSLQSEMKRQRQVARSWVKKNFTLIQQQGKMLGFNLGSAMAFAGYRGASATLLHLAWAYSKSSRVSFVEAKNLFRYDGQLLVPFPHESFMDSASAIGLIHEAGGKAVLAHPGVILRQVQGCDLEKFKRLIIDLQSHGLDGIEAWHHHNTPELSDWLLKLAATCNLFPTGGSDNHGDFHPDRPLGKYGLNEGQFQSFLSWCLE